MMDMAAAASAVDGKGDISRAVRSEMKEIFVLSWPVSMTRLIICITRLAVRIYMYIYMCVCVCVLFVRT